MKDLKEYVDDLNFRRNLFGNKLALDLGVPEHREIIRGNLEGDLSPENLTCDGELSAADVRARAAFLRRVEEQLEKWG